MGLTEIARLPKRAGLSWLGIFLLSLTACSLLSPPPAPTPQPPLAAFEIRWLDNFTVELNAFNSSAAKGRQIESYQWDFGDGEQVTDHLYMMQHHYEKPGRYVITLTVQDEVGLTASAQKDVFLVPEGDVEFEQLYYSLYSGVNNPISWVIHTQEELERLWQEALRIQTPLPDLPVIDFREEMVVAIFLGNRPDLGYGIRAERVRAEQGKLKIWYTETKLGGYGCAAPPAISSPMLLLRSQRVELPAVFSSRVEIVPCPR